MDELKKIPGVDTLLHTQEIRELVAETNIDLVKYVIRNVLSELKDGVRKGKQLANQQLILHKVITETKILRSNYLKKVINGTGIVIHTNLGRAPYSRDLLNEAFEVLNGYNNLEFDLDTASRGSRNAHASDLLKYLCGAEDVLVVNNNAAAVVLILRAFAKGRDVIVSRGELIEIGGSFRLPDIIASSDCHMREVGTTNKTKVTDYEKAISEHTGVLFKAHKSNYSIEGFTQEVSLDELVALGKKNKIPVVYDMGSGLLNDYSVKEFKHEPNVKQTLKLGVDLVCFSGDKLLGGPQAGIIAGKKKLIEKLKKEPLLRALRVDKLTLAFLETNNRYFLDESVLYQKNLFYKMLNQSPQELENKANRCKALLAKCKIDAEVIQNKGQFGGGALPGKEIDSFAVQLNLKKDTARQRSELAKMIYKELLQQKIPVLGILRKGNIYFDMLCITDGEMELVTESIAQVHKKLAG
ncbi:MAG: L-seryl-tRNA(Sec) selenium transferase [Bacteroidetes bacterium]|nr:L-seryl-tRNA(Sec) selenium transferase [Bacteroidota bacterium]